MINRLYISLVILSCASLALKAGDDKPAIAPTSKKDGSSLKKTQQRQVKILTKRTKNPSKKSPSFPIKIFGQNPSQPFLSPSKILMDLKSDLENQAEIEREALARKREARIRKKQERELNAQQQPNLPTVSIPATRPRKIASASTEPKPGHLSSRNKDDHKTTVAQKQPQKSIAFAAKSRPPKLPISHGKYPLPKPISYAAATLLPAPPSYPSYALSLQSLQTIGVYGGTAEIDSYDLTAEPESGYLSLLNEGRQRATQAPKLPEPVTFASKTIVPGGTGYALRLQNLQKIEAVTAVTIEAAKALDRKCIDLTDDEWAQYYQ